MEVKSIRTNDEIIQIITEQKDILNLSTSELARRVGMAKSAVSRYLNKTREFPLNRVNDFSKVLGVSSEYILGFDENSSTIETIYNQLDEPRQEKVYSFAEEQLEEQQNSKVVPIVGTTAANPEVVTYGDAVHGEYCEAPNNADYAIVVKGDSMEPDYADGSTVYYIKQEAVENGELAIVEVDGEGVTFKKVLFDYDNKKVILRSLNKEYPDRVLGSNRVQIIGRVTK